MSMKNYFSRLKYYSVTLGAAVKRHLNFINASYANFTCYYYYIDELHEAIISRHRIGMYGAS